MYFDSYTGHLLGILLLKIKTILVDFLLLRVINNNQFVLIFPLLWHVIVFPKSKQFWLIFPLKLYDRTEGIKIAALSTNFVHSALYILESPLKVINKYTTVMLTVFF